VNYFCGEIKLEEITQSELLLASWVRLSGIIKNSRITKGLMYNEAVVMYILYMRYRSDGDGIISIKEIVERTRMQKSLVNRTVNSLEEKGLLLRCESEIDRRMTYVKCVREKLDTFLKVHEESLAIADNIIDIIGPEDAEAFIRIVYKLEEADYSVN